MNQIDDDPVAPESEISKRASRLQIKMQKVMFGNSSATARAERNEREAEKNAKQSALRTRNLRDMAKTSMWRYLPCKRLTGKSVLTEDQVGEVRYLYQDGFTRYKIAKMMGCSWPTINRIVKQRTHVQSS